MDNFPKKEKNLSNPNFVHPLTLRIYPMSRRIILTWNGSADYTSKSISNISGIDPKGRVWHVNSDLYCNFVTCYLDGQEETMVTASLALDGNSHPLIHTGNTIYDWATPRAWNVCKYHEIWILSNVLISFQLCIKLLFSSFFLEKIPWPSKN